MLSTLKEILRENWQWRSQTANLAVIDLHKTVRGAVLGWAWLFVKPITYIAVFWFALELGLRQGAAHTEYPYLLWLTAGLIPWFFMQEMLNTGSNVYRRYPFLVNRIHFPLSVISTFYTLSQFIIYLALVAGMLLVCVFTGTPLTVYALQLIPVSILLFLFWNCFSILTSPLSAISKDFYNLLKAFATPLFWISGIIFNVYDMNIHALTAILAYNPVTFFATACRASLCEQYWIWEKPDLFLPFLVVFAVTFVAMLWVYKKLRRDVADVL